VDKVLLAVAGKGEQEGADKAAWYTGTHSCRGQRPRTIRRYTPFRMAYMNRREGEAAVAESMAHNHPDKRSKSRLHGKNHPRKQWMEGEAVEEEEARSVRNKSG